MLKTGLSSENMIYDGGFLRGQLVLPPRCPWCWFCTFPCLSEMNTLGGEYIFSSFYTFHIWGVGGAFLEYNFSLEVWHEFIGMNYLEGLCWTSRSGCSFLWQHCPWCWLFSTLHHRCPWDWLLSFPCQRCPWCWFFSFSFHWDKPCPWCWSNLHCLPKMSTVHGTETVASVSFWHGRCPWCWSNQLSLCLWAGWCLLSVCYVSDIDNVSLKKYSHKSSIF